MDSFTAPYRVRSEYRPDIDGLRAVAIIFVVLFHSFPSLFPGGFIGVDIFFVISGYLITSIILTKLNRAEFSLVDFYIHRVRRIFPALVVVLVAVFGFGWLLLFASEFKQLGAHLFASAFFAENFMLYSQTGYFDTAADLKPLMHLWSLAIEEQFYIFFPPLMLLIWRWKRSAFLTLCVLALLSFVASAALTIWNPAGAFLFPFSRAWELFAGSLLAYVKVGAGRKQNDAVRLGFGGSSAVTAVALACLSLLVVFWRKDWPFPGLIALLPVGFAVGAIVAGDRLSPRGNLLTARPLVAVGLFSYPLYLWHWPILSFLHIVKGADDSPAYRIIGCLLSVAMAYLVYRWIERPLRFGGRAERKALFLCAAIVLLAGVGAYTYVRDGFPFRYVERVANGAVRPIVLDRTHMRPGCGLSTRDAEQFQNCFHDDRAEPSIALIGDSKANVLAPAIFAFPNPRSSWSFIGGVTQTGALVPVLTHEDVYGFYHAQAKLAVDRVASMESIKVVVLTTATRALFLLANDHSIEDLPKSSMYDTARDGLGQAVNRLVGAGKKVILTVDNPTLPAPDQCAYRMTVSPVLNRILNLHAPPKCQIQLDTFLEQSKTYRNLLSAIQSDHPDDVVIVDFTDLLCDQRKRICDATMEGRRLYSYTDHVSDFAAEKMAARLVPIAERLRDGGGQANPKQDPR